MDPGNSKSDRAEKCEQRQSKSTKSHESSIRKSIGRAENHKFIRRAMQERLKFRGVVLVRKTYLG